MRNFTHSLDIPNYAKVNITSVSFSVKVTLCISSEVYCYLLDRVNIGVEDPEMCNEIYFMKGNKFYVSRFKTGEIAGLCNIRRYAEDILSKLRCRIIEAKISILKDKLKEYGYEKSES